MTARASVPSADAFYMPADACRQARLWLPWPAEDAALQAAVGEVARAAAAFEPVALLTAPGGEQAARAVCGEALSDIFPLAPTTLHLRGTGPTFLVDGKGGSAAVDWRFNGWGGRGPDADAGLAHSLLGVAEVRRFRAPLTLEGSSVVADGRGTVLALEPAVFDPLRNPGLTPLHAFGIFQDWLAAARVVWIGPSHPGDGLVTDIRACAAFAAPGLVAINDPAAHPSFAKISETLARTRDAQGKPFELISLPAPSSEHVMSYTNVLPVNGGLLVPAFDLPSDARAADLLAEVFPERIIRPVPARGLAMTGVTLTALTLPHPARLLERDRAKVLPRSAWSRPTPDAEALLQHYIDLAKD